MKAFYIDQPFSVFVRETDMPEAKDDELIIKVMAVGLCGTDVHIYKGEYYGDYPRIPGHEFSGLVTSVGEKCTRFKLGQRVAADPNIFCEACPACKSNLQNFCEEMHAVGVTRHGAMAEYVAVPERCVFDIGEMSFTEAAMIEPLACVVHGQNAIQIPLGGNVLIFGAGPIGLMQLQASLKNGAATVTMVDLFKEKLELARKLGAAHTYTSEQFAKLNYQNSYEAVIDCTGVPSVVENAIQYIKDAGTMLFFGVCPTDSKINLNPYEVFKRELTLIGTFALRKTYDSALKMIQNKNIRLLDLIGTKAVLADAPEIFKMAASGNSGLKVIFYPNGIQD